VPVSSPGSLAPDDCCGGGVGRTDGVVDADVVGEPGRNGTPILVWGDCAGSGAALVAAGSAFGFGLSSLLDFGPEYRALPIVVEFFMAMTAGPRPDLLGGDGECLLRRELPVASSPRAARAHSRNRKRLLSSILILLGLQVLLHLS
jgi:hypothetical protein